VVATEVDRPIGSTAGWVTIDASASAGGTENSSAAASTSRSQSDLSPTRRRRRLDSADEDDTSPPRRPVGADLSPPRRRRRRVDTDDEGDRGGGGGAADLSPPRSRTAAAAREDLSPPRRRRRRADTDDEGEVEGGRGRGGGEAPDMSPPRRRAGAAAPDLSPPRRQQQRPRADGDLSPPRKPREPDLSPPRSHKEARLSSGVKAGLRTGSELEAETKRIRKEQDERFKKMEPEQSGAHAPTIYRDRRGRKLDMLTEIMNRDKGTKDPESESNYEWGVGAAKKQKQEDAQQLLQEEREQPFARLPDDPSLDAHYRSIQRWGDPMAGLVSESKTEKSKKKKKEKKEKKDKKDKKKRKKKGEPDEDAVCKYRAPPNRFNIPPGPRWDGRDRSNGFEKRLFERQSLAAAQQREAYAWSVESM